MSFFSPRKGEKKMTVELKQIISDLQKNFTENPEKAVLDYESNSTLNEGLQSNVTVRNHKVVVDEPTSFGGKDEGPSPVELILAALGSCQEITYKAFATALGINLESVSVKLKAKLDLKGFLAIDDNTRPGFQNIDGTVDIKSSSSKAEIRKLIQVVDQHCPVLDILTKGVPVKLNQRFNSVSHDNYVKNEQRISVA
jgi:uncharacterized OsmC-like protein